MKPTYDCYPEYEKCIKKLVWYYVKRSRFSFDELLSEANMGFLHAVDTYNPDKAGFHTHCFITVGGCLKNYCKQEVLEMELPDNTLSSKTSNPEQHCTFHNLLDNLSTEAKEIVDTVFNCPAEMIDIIKTMSSNRHKNVCLRKANITKYFRTKGWTYYKIWNTYSEIKSTLWG